MKRLLILLCLPLLFTSCESTFGRYCASCTEQNTGYLADDYCGTNTSVNVYINDMESYDPAYPDQVWSCYKFKD